MIDISSVAKKMEDLVANSLAALKDRISDPKIVDISASSSRIRAFNQKNMLTKTRELDISYDIYDFDHTATTNGLVDLISKITAVENVIGVSFSLPAYPHIDTEAVTENITYYKDIEGLSRTNYEKIYYNKEQLSLVPPLAMTVIHVLEHISSIRNAHIAVVGSGRSSARPICQMLFNRRAIVTSIHPHNPKISEILMRADVIITIASSQGTIKHTIVDKNKIIIDCGLSYEKDDLVTDTDPDAQAAAGLYFSLKDDLGEIVSLLKIYNGVCGYQIGMIHNKNQI